MGALLLGCVIVAHPAPAQDASVAFESGSGAAYLALTTTPIGALAPSHDFLLRRRGEAPMPMRLHGNFGAIDRDAGITQRTWAATLDMPVGTSSLSLTAGYVDIVCSEEATGGFDVALTCPGGLTVGARLGRALASRTMDPANTSTLVLGVEGSAGFADLDVAKLELLGAQLDVKSQGLSVGAALPLALVVHSGTTIISPGVRPGLAWGRAKVDLGDGEHDTSSGVRAMIGASVAVRFGPRFGFDFGLQHVFFDQSDTALGLSASFGF